VHGGWSWRRLPAADSLLGYEAARLFVERVRAASPGFELTERNAVAVARICHRLDGMPLAIELAAARARVLSAEQIASRLEDSFELLAGQGRPVVAHQGTLRATMDWSFELLSGEERVLLRRLSVFAGSFGLAAAEGACSGDGIERGDVLDLLSSLVDKSLVVVKERDGEARYRLLETVRQYAAEKLGGSGEAERVRERHAEFFLTLAEELEPAMWGAEEGAWLGRLEAEDDNLRAALSWAIEHDTELGLRLAGALRWYWYWRGHYGEGRGWLDEALKKGGAGTSVAARAKALHAVGWLAHDQGDMRRAEEAAEEGIELGRSAEIADCFAASFRNLLGEAARHRGDFRRATAQFEEGTALYREAGDRRGVAWGLFLQGNASSLRDDHERATELYEEGLVLCRELGGAQPLGDYLSHLGYEFLLRGDHERAATLNEQAAALLRSQGYKGGLQFALNNLGWVALDRGLDERAEALYGESLLLCRELGDRLTASESLDGLACAAGSRGATQRAARLFGAAGALREAVGYRQAPRGRALREPHLRAARSRVDKEAWEAAWSEGMVMSQEEAVEYALTTDVLTSPTKDAAAPSLLSTREAEVLRLAADGLTDAQAAERLYVSPRTVGRHLQSAYRKLGVSSRAAAAKEALQRGLI
jgi:DNA-binding CsgD family transcriptional regulator/tetratricopeptide (TPR) repeat protein